MKLLLIALGLGAACAQFAVPLVRVESGREYLTRIGRTDLITNRPYVLATNSSSVLSDYQDLFYMANVTLSKNAQSFLMAMDTSSGDTWVPSITCVQAGAGGCYGKDGFTPSSSTNASTALRFSIPANPPGLNNETYGPGTVSGLLDSDEFCFTKELCDEVAFGDASTVANYIAYLKMDGVVGLGLTSSYLTGSVIPPFVQMWNDAQVPTSYFTFYMKALGTNSTGAAAGQITFGGIDKTNCGSVIWVHRMPNPGLSTIYQVAMTGGKVDTTDLSATSAALDTGSSFIWGPQSEVQKIGTAMGATFDSSKGMYYVSCPHGITDVQTPDISFIIDSKTYTVTKANYLLKNLQIDSNKCYIAVKAWSANFGRPGPQWIFGAPFLRAYCTTFDVHQQRIGFATAK